MAEFVLFALGSGRRAWKGIGEVIVQSCSCSVEFRVK